MTAALLRRARRAAVLVAAVVVLAPGTGPLAGIVSAEETAVPPAQRVTAPEAADPDHWHPEGTDDRPETGELFLGLDDSATCRGGYAVEDTPATPNARHCTHGPDPAPAGIDVRDVPTVTELRAEATASAEAAGSATAADAAGAGDGSSADAGAVPCYGDGATGKRVQVIYAVAADRPDRYAQVADLIRGYAYQADQTFARSAARDGGVRHVRWVTDAGCRLTVDHVVLSATGDDSIGNTRTELRELGYTSVDRKYLVFADAGVYCGIAYVVSDTQPGPANAANRGPTVARVDAGCWPGSTSVAAHELAHVLGAVQLSAPHSNGSWHCSDDYDRMCYADGISTTPMTYLCDGSSEGLLDCGGDDYFSLNPAPGSWLETHWNLANSAFLEAAEPATGGPAPPPSPTAAPAPTVPSVPTTAPPVVTPPVEPVVAPPPASPPSPSPSPIPTTTGPPGSADPAPRVSTVRFRGRLTVADPVRTYRVRSGPGRLVARLDSATTGSLRVRLSGTAGPAARTRAGSPGGLRLTAQVRGGSYRVTVRGPIGTAYVLSVTRVLR